MKKIILYLLCLIIFCIVIFGRVNIAYASEPTSPWLLNNSLPYQISSQVSFPYINELFSIGGSIAGGQNKFDAISAHQNINGTLDGWGNTSAPLPSALIVHSSAIKDKYVYVLAGFQDNTPGLPTGKISTVFMGQIDGSGNIPSWTTTTSLPQPESAGEAAVVGNRIYFAGGDGVNVRSDKIYWADILANGQLSAWTETTNLPYPVSGYEMVADGNNHLIILGGTVGQFIGGAYTNKVYTSLVNPDGSIGPWQQTSSFPVALARSGAVVNQNTLFLLGGVGYSGNSNQVYYATIKADGTLGDWQTSTNLLPKTICCGRAVTLNNYIYVIGGHDGGDYLNSVYFTKVQSQSQDLPVASLKQTTDPWGSQEYDLASIWSPNFQSIGSWGCALTSATMVFNYYGLNKLPDGTTLDPGSLNTWLKNQPDGYVGGGLLNWIALSRLSKLAKNINNINSFDALEYSRINGENKLILATDLQNLHPDILEVPGHFIVAKGQDGSNFHINDPFYNKNNLSDYSNTFLSLGEYTPSQTDLSYILLTVDPNISVSIKNNTNQEVGDQFIQQPLGDDLNNGVTTGHSLKIIYLKKPDSGNFKITTSGNNNLPFLLNEYFYDKNGDLFKQTESGITGNSNPNTIAVIFDKDNKDNSKSNHIVTFDSFLNDILEAKSLGYVQKTIANTLTDFVKNTKNYASKNKKAQEKARLDAILSLLKALKGKGINQTAYDVFLFDTNYLESHI